MSGGTPLLALRLRRAGAHLAFASAVYLIGCNCRPFSRPRLQVPANWDPHAAGALGAREPLGPPPPVVLSRACPGCLVVPGLVRYRLGDHIAFALGKVEFAWRGGEGVPLYGLVDQLGGLTARVLRLGGDPMRGSHSPVVWSSEEARRPHHLFSYPS